MHCPEEAQPAITFLGVVTTRGGQLNNGSTLLHYGLQSTVYNNSSRTEHTFPITAYFKNGPRWVNFPPLALNIPVFISGRVFGVTKENQQLAVIVDDVHFLPTSTVSVPPSPSSTPSKRKRPNRWMQRAGPSTPSKSIPYPNRASSASPHRPEIHTPSQDNDAKNDSLGIQLDKDTEITWPDTADEADSPPQTTSPTPERRSQRPRKTSYADILAQSR